MIQEKMLGVLDCFVHTFSHQEFSPLVHLHWPLTQLQWQWNQRWQLHWKRKQLSTWNKYFYHKKTIPPLKDIFIPTCETSPATNTGVSIVMNQKKMGKIISNSIPALRTWHQLKGIWHKTLFGIWVGAILKI